MTHSTNNIIFETDVALRLIVREDGIEWAD